MKKYEKKNEEEIWKKVKKYEGKMKKQYIIGSGTLKQISGWPLPYPGSRVNPQTVAMLTLTVSAWGDSIGITKVGLSPIR